MAGQTLRSLIVSVSAETGGYQREMARAGRMGSNYLRTITAGNRDATTSWRSQEAAIRAQESALGSLSGAVAGYARAMAGALAAGSLIHMADEWGQISSRLKLATSSQDEFTDAQSRLMDITRITFKSFSESAELYIRTIGVLKEFGGSAEDALRMTEALSLGLAVSGTNAQATASVIDQVSKSLEGGKLQGDGFNAVVTQAPRLLKALQDSLGKTRDELRKMASDGKLTVDVVATAWVSQIGAMKTETEGMATSVADASVRMRDSLMQYIGMVDNGTGTTGKLASALNLASDNIDVLAKAAATIGIGLIAKRSLEAANALRLQAMAARNTASAEIGRTTAQVDAAAASLRLAKADVIASQRQVAFATTAAEATLASRALTRAKLDELAATRALAVAQASQTAAMSLSGRLASGLLGILGGPIGLAAIVAGTAASFLLFSNNASAANTAVVDLKRPITELREEWEALGAAQRRPILSKLLEEQQSAKNRAAEIVEEMKTVSQGPLKSSFTGPNNFQANQYKRASAAGNFGRSIRGGLDIDASTQSLISTIGPTKEIKTQLEDLAREYEENILKVGTFGDQIGVLNEVMLNAKEAVEGVSAGLQSIKPPNAELVSAWEKRIDGLTEKTSKLKDSTALGEVNRQAERDGLGQTSEGRAIQAQAQAAAKLADVEAAANKSREESARKAKQVADTIERQAKQLQDNYSRTLKTLNEQADVHGKKTELAKIEFETTKGTLSKLDAAKKVDLERAAIALDHLNTQKSYKELMDEVQKREDGLLVTTRKRYEELARLKSQGGLTSDQYAVGAEAISKDSVSKAPKFTGIDASVGGASGELIKVAEADKELAKWHEKELARQKELLDTRVGYHQEYADRVAEIEQANFDRMGTIQEAYKSATLGVFSSMTGNVADLMGDMVGKSSAAYKIMFAASKASAIAQAIVNTQEASTKALTMGPIFGIPAAALVTGLGYASIGIMAATAVAGFSEGGYTGRGGKFEPMGIVHGGEFVLRKEIVEQPGMRPYLEGLNKRGYASGGYVGTAGSTPSFTAPQVSAGSLGGAPEIHLHINGDGSGGSVSSTEGYEAMGQALLATVRAEMPKIARGVIIQEKGQNGLLDPSNRRNS